MKNAVEEIFDSVSDQREILSAINVNLQPVLQMRKGTDIQEDYFNRLCFCLGYHIRKTQILKSIIFTYFKHNTIKKGLGRHQIEENVDGILSSESGMREIIDMARQYHKRTSFRSNEQRDASYLISCMKQVIEVHLLVGFVDYVSNRKHKSFLSYSYDELVGFFDASLEKHTGSAFQGVMKSM